MRGPQVTPDVVTALKERLEHAAASLLDMQMEAYTQGRTERYVYLKVKREGVTLALSYLDEELRLREGLK